MRQSKYSKKQMTVTDIQDKIFQPCFFRGWGYFTYPKLTSTGKLPHFGQIRKTE